MSFNSRAHGGRESQPFHALLSPRGFNSRAHGGRDLCNGRRIRPTRGFNSRAHGGRDSSGLSLTAPAGLFQFTRPRGARLIPQVVPTLQAGFNSRAHGGRDGRPPKERRWRNVSIHAPTGGATTITLDNCSDIAVSIHAPTGGATVSRRPRQSPRQSFNSRAHGGRDSNPRP